MLKHQSFRGTIHQYLLVIIFYFHYRLVCVAMFGSNKMEFGIIVGPISHNHYQEHNIFHTKFCFASLLIYSCEFQFINNTLQIFVGKCFTFKIYM